MGKSARRYAAEALMRINVGGYSNIVSSNMLKNCDLDPADKLFASAIVYGVIERLITLDKIIEAYSKVKKLSPEVKAILRCALYQIMYMDSVPNSAAVNEAVKLTNKMKVKSAGGFVNAVLRNFLKNGIPEKLLSNESFKYSCSEDIIRIIKESIGNDKTAVFLDSSFGKPPMFIRVNSLKTSCNELKSLLEATDTKKISEVFWTKNCMIYEERDVAENIFFKKGFYYVQDLSSQLCVKALDLTEGLRLLDVCAAPGGKSFTAAQEMNNKGEILSCDIHKNRLQLIEEGKKRLGIDIVKVTENNGTEYNEQFGLFDRVLCDVPCSGTGVIRRKPEIKYKSEKEISALYDVQLQILNTSSRYLKQGGILVYSTCSINKKENEDIVLKFLKDNDDFELVKFSVVDGEQENNGMKTILTENYNSDGFFIAKLMRKK